MKISRFNYEAPADATSLLGSRKDRRLNGLQYLISANQFSAVQQVAAKENLRDRVSRHSLA